MPLRVRSNESIFVSDIAAPNVHRENYSFIHLLIHFMLCVISSEAISMQRIFRVCQAW